jgi:hypothetical protein
MLLLLFNSAELAAYSLSAESGTLTLSAPDPTLTYVPVPPHPQTGGSVLARGGRRGRRSGSGQHVTHTSGPSTFGTRWVQVEELTPEERAAKDAMIEARLAEEAYQRAREAREAEHLAAERAEAYRLANLRHIKLKASGAELHVTKKRSHTLVAKRSLKAGERFVLIRPSVAQITRTHLFSVDGGTLGIDGGNVDLIHRGVAENLALAQAHLKRLKDDHEAMTLLLLAA